ncbi:hypothetical protein BDY19DRAFT_896736 [Irpex rosettiformis]|uniref:Uncharacterized protein n=1 Tax=Irpex rosettiformis TaxID=378272 RepID=A0ACB8TTL1_9APHY|nr:hypothetical protein BDY19DRAFT_896736 [Irpex rosettiformis]
MSSTVCSKPSLPSFFTTAVSVFSSKRSLARLLSTFLCCIVIVVRPFSRLGGRYAFLVLALKELVFSVQASLAQQLELTVLNILGAFLGIAVSTLAKFIASRYPNDSATARGTCAVFLVIISFFAGLIKSRLPRLQLSTRISCFVSIWILTNDIGDSAHVLTASGNFLWITLSAALICIFSLLLVMSLLHWTSTNFEQEMASAFTTIHRSLELGLTLSFPHPLDPPVDKHEYDKLRTDLLQRSVRLNDSYSQAAFELRVGRLSLRSIRPLVTTVEHLRRELAWGMPLHRIPRPQVQLHENIRRPPGLSLSAMTSPLPSPPLPARNLYTDALETPARALGEALLHATECVEDTIILAFHQNNPPARLFSWGPHASQTQTPASSSSINAEKASTHGWTTSQLAALHEAESRLVSCRDSAREAIGEVFEDDLFNQRHTDASVKLPQDARNCSLAVIALLQMAYEIRLALQIAQRFANRYDSSRTRLWFPRVSLAWLGVPPGSFISDDPNALLGSTSRDNMPDLNTDYGETEFKQGLREHVYRVDVRKSATNAAILRMSKRGTSVKDGEEQSSRLQGLGELFWTSRRALKLRLRVWRFLQAVRHSSHLRHAAKAAVGVAVLTFPAFLPRESQGCRWFTSVHGQWMTISYLWVLETNTGATWRTGYLRILGTCCGSFYAYITYLICKTNAYGLVALVTAFDIPITWLITQTSLTPFAVPASVALPTIVLARYISGPATGPVVILSLLRAAMISLGMIAALLMNSLVFPRHSRVYFLFDTSRTLGLLTDLYLSLSHEIFTDKATLSRDSRRKALKLELEVRNSLHRLSAFITTMHSEFSLLPKPLRHYRRLVSLLQNMLDLLTGLRKIRENIPRKITVYDVIKERREFMSCVCIALFACQHAFKAHEPLPQFLPSARHALETLETEVRERILAVPENDIHALGLSLVNAFAEQEVMRNMVDTLEALLESTGSLFGTSAWLTHDTHWSKLTIHNDEGHNDHGWYSTLRWEEA